MESEEYSEYLLDSEKIISKFEASIIITLKERELFRNGTLIVTNAQSFFALPSTGTSFSKKHIYHQKKKKRMKKSTHDKKTSF